MRFRRYKLKVFLTAFILSAANVFGGTVEIHLYINRGDFTTVKQTTFPFLAFNETSVFNPLNKVVSINTADTVEFIVVNKDTATHGFKIDDYTMSAPVINPGDSATIAFHSSSEKIFIYYDPYDYPENRYMGLGGMICVNNGSHQKYYWNLKEHQTQFNYTLASAGNVNWSDYAPDYFTINGLSFPDLQLDTMSNINASVGDTILIFIANTGQSLHSLHFHGFHCETLFATGKRIAAGSLKDTFPLKRMEAVVLRMIPDKPGQYSVHDHNLVAVTGGNTHPNGMFTIMTIQQ